MMMFNGVNKDQEKNNPLVPLGAAESKDKKERFVCEENEQGKFVCEPEKNSGDVSLLKKERDGAEVEIQDEEIRTNAPEIDTKKGNIFIGTLNIMSSPAKALAKPFVKHYRKKYHEKYIHAKKLFILDMALLGVIVVLVLTSAYFFLGGGVSFFTVSEKARLDISYNQEKLISGEEADFIFSYLNNSKDVLQNASLTVNLPKHFEILSYEPETFDSASHTFTVGALNPGGNGQVKIIGKIYDNINKPGKITSTLHYMAGKRKGSDQAVLNYTLSESIVGANLEAPETVVKNQEFSFNIKYYNNSSSDFSEFIIVPLFGEGFKIISAEPASGEDGKWHLPLEGETNAVISLTGVVSSDSENISPKLKSYLPIGGDELLQKEDEKVMSIVNPRFSLALSSSEAGAVNLGEEINYKITYQNNGDFNLRNVSFELGHDDQFIETGAEKVFDSKTNPELALIRPCDRGEISFSVKIKIGVSAETILEGDPLIKSFIKANYILEDKAERNVSEQTPIFEKKINTNLSLESFARYYTSSGEQLGRGPLPPEAGFTTKYWVFWYPLNNLSDAEDVVVTAVLSDNVEFTGASLPLGVLDYNVAARVISWRAGRVNKYNGSQGKGLSFEVAFNPAESQIGATPDLITNIKITGKDSFTGEVVSKTAEDISIDLPYDTYTTPEDSRVAGGF